MRIKCPYCGERGSEEFSFRGPAGLERPEAGAHDAAARFHDYVYLRDNPAGPNAELWFHARGCRSWLVVERDTRTHEIGAVRLAMPDPDEAG